MAGAAAVEVVLALGSNLGDRLGYLRLAVGELHDVVAQSSVWETEPIGGPDGQGAYLNMVVELDTRRTPRELLAEVRRVEAAGGRERLVRWGPRTLDADILWIDGTRVREPDLHIPHPRIAERAFVLAPLEELAPGLVPPEWRDQHPSGITRLGRLDQL